MRTAWIALACICASGCTDLVTVEVGADRVEPIELSETLPLGVALTACPTVTIPIVVPGAEAATASSAPSDGGCAITAQLSNAVIVDRETIAAQKQSLGTFDVTALVGIDVELVELELVDENGRSLPVERVTIATDDQLLFDTTIIGVQSPRPRSALPESVVAQFRSALATPADVRADLALQITFASAAAVPKRIGVRMVLQPILLIDVVRAAL